MIQLHSIEPHMVEIMWPKIVKFVDMACEYSNGELNSDIILKDVLGDRLRLIIMRNEKDIVAVMTLKIEQFETGKKVLTALTVGGSDIDSWVNEIDGALNSIAKEQDCSEMYIVGRAGWVRKLKSIGYDKVHTVLAKKVA